MSFESAKSPPSHPCYTSGVALLRGQPRAAAPTWALEIGWGQQVPPLAVAPDFGRNDRGLGSEAQSEGSTSKATDGGVRSTHGRRRFAPRTAEGGCLYIRDSIFENKAAERIGGIIRS